MSFWLTLAEAIESRMVAAGMDIQSAAAQSCEAICEATKSHAGESMLIPVRPRALQPHIDAQIADAVRAYGLLVAAQRHQCHKITVIRAMGRHRLSKRKRQKDG